MKKDIASILNDIIPIEHRWKIDVLRQWDSIIGPLKGKVTIDAINGNVLVLGVTHPAWAQELLMLMPLLKQKINACCDRERIAVIRFRFIDKQRIASKTNGFKGKKRKALLPFVGHDTLNHAETVALDTVKYQPLRQALEHFLYASRQMNRERK